MNPLPALSITNPYNFSLPVITRAALTGREAEMQEIEYYLDQSKSNHQAISVAILGRRASGKTSILNIAAQHASNIDLCVARVDLDEDDSDSQLIFLFKVFDSVLYAAHSIGLFSDPLDRTMDCYMDCISTYRTIESDEAQWFPFVFPQFYARAMSAGNISAPVPLPVLKRDFETLANLLRDYLTLR